MPVPSRDYLISEFRKHVPDAFDQVVQQRGLTVRVSRRGVAERAVFVSEAYVEELHARLRRLQRRVTALLQGSGNDARFQLAASAELTVPPGEVFRPAREEQAGRRHSKLQDI